MTDFMKEATKIQTAIAAFGLDSKETRIEIAVSLEAIDKAAYERGRESAPAPTAAKNNIADAVFTRLVEFFDKDETAAAFLSEDGDGGFIGAVYRMAREIDRLRSQSPRGWKLMPVEPTEEMVEAGKRRTFHGKTTISILYEVMLEAAPTPEGGE